VSAGLAITLANLIFFSQARANFPAKCSTSVPIPSAFNPKIQGDFCMPDKTFQELEACLLMFGWIRGGDAEQYFANGDEAQPGVLFHNHAFHSSVFALHPLVNRRLGSYADWALYEEGTITNWGNGAHELLACLSRMSVFAD
jgi:hypothetical protein